MNRKYVHLSTNENTAIQVGKRKTILKREEPVIIAISASEACNTGIYYFLSSYTFCMAD